MYVDENNEKNKIKTNFTLMVNNIKNNILTYKYD